MNSGGFEKQLKLLKLKQTFTSPNVMCFTKKL